MKDTRNKLLKISARIFARKGYTATSVRDIANAAHINVSAIAYYFGGKQGLFLETVRSLLEQHRQQIWGGQPSPTNREIDAYSYKQALDILHTMFDKLLDNSLNRKSLPLERIFTQVELETVRMRKMLFEYMAPFHQLPYKLLTKLTGLPEKSPELLCVMHCIFGQLWLSESHRLVIEHTLGGASNYSPELRAKIKQTVWAHTLAILNLYNKGTQKQ